MSALGSVFLIATSSGTTRRWLRTLGIILGWLTLTERQAQRLAVKAYTQGSLYLEKCCLLLSANEAYERVADDVDVGHVRLHPATLKLSGL